MYKYFFISFLVFMAFACNNKAKNNSDNGDQALADSIERAMESISDDNSLYLLVGTYTSGESEGIYVYQFDTVSAYSKPISEVKVANPSYLTLSTSEKYVYAVSENEDNTAAANAFEFDKKTGKLKFINKELTGGAAPCYINIDNSGKYVATANYLGGSLTVFKTKEDGSLEPASDLISFSGKGADAKRQSQSHIHCLRYTPDGKYLFATDLGTDKIHKFVVNENDLGKHLKVGTPQAFDVPQGSGPRHLTFHPNGKYAYLINELSGTVIAYDYADGMLTQKQVVLSDTLNAQGSADVHVSPDGRFLYSSNRLAGDGIAIFSIDQNDGLLTKVGYQNTGIHPRNFVLTPNGKFLLVASRDSGVIQIFSRDAKTGLLEDTFKDIVLDMPVCMQFASFK